MKKKLFVLSMDAMVHEDVAYMMTKPNFARLFAKRAEVERMCSVFPSSTYPAHTTLITGCQPGKHGIYTNVPLKDYEDNRKHWYLDSKIVRTEDLFAAAKRAGCSTASVYWPICGNNPNIDFIINEYFFYYAEEDTMDAFRKMGARGGALKAIEENLAFVDARRRKEPGASFDLFAMKCACSLIRNEQPDVLLVHNCVLDSTRHEYGVFGEKLTRALDRTDEWLGEVIQAMEEAGVYEDTNFVLLSDHGQMNYEKRVRVNMLLEREGLIDLAPDGKIYDWQAYSQSNGMSATIHLRDPGDKALYDRVYALLNRWVDEGTYGFTRIYTTEEARETYGTYGPYSFMIATNGKTSISERWAETVEEVLGADEQKPLQATHGYEPELGPQPVFLGRGPAFREGAVLPRAHLMDVAPTLARILGQELPAAEGRCLQELLK